MAILKTEQLKEKMKEYLESTDNDVQKACQAFYSDLLQGKSVIGKMDGQEVNIKFTANGKSKLRYLAKANKITDEILPYVPEIITTGKYAGKTRGYKTEDGGHKIFAGFLYFQKRIPTSRGFVNTVVDVGITATDGKQEYSFISKLDKARYNKKKRLLGEEGILLESVRVLTPSVDETLKTGFLATLPERFDDDNIPLSFEFVNVQIKNIFENALEAAYANEFHDNFSDLNYAFGLDL